MHRSVAVLAFAFVLNMSPMQAGCALHDLPEYDTALLLLFY
jgi:hypothetical protein